MHLTLIKNELFDVIVLQFNDTVCRFTFRPLKYWKYTHYGVFPKGIQTPWVTIAKNKVKKTNKVFWHET